MSEKNQLRDAVIKGFIVLIFSTLYSLGGMEGGGGIWIRRFLAPTCLCGGMYYFSRDWRSLVGLPLMFCALSLGYGADLVWVKVLKRGLFALANGTATSAYNLLNKNWLLCGLQMALLLGIIITLGVWNILPNARTEELTIGAVIALIPMMSAKRRDA